MNNTRRKAIEAVRNLIGEANTKLSEARDWLEMLKDEEAEYRDAMPESLQQGDKFERAEAAIDAMETAIGEIEGCDFDSIFDSLNTAVE